MAHQRQAVNAKNATEATIACQVPEHEVGDEVEHARERERARHGASDGLPIPLPEQVVLVPLPEADTVVRSRREEEHERRRSAEERRVVDVAIGVADVCEHGREADREQEAEEDGGAGDQRAELL